ncbi:MAG TPA: hypothetical protein VF011_18915 [Terriglobales bacterium]
MTPQTPSLYYFAAWTDSGCVLGCDHQHETVISAVACCAPAGAYVIAVENGDLRELNEAEESEFQHAMYGYDFRRTVTAVIGVLVFIYRFAGSHF